MIENYEMLVRQAQDESGQHDAFNELVRMFQGTAFRYAYATLGDSQLAEDATQDAFITAYQHINQLREPAAFPGWLRRIVWKHCDRITRKKYPQDFAFDGDFILASDSSNPEQTLEEQEMVDRVQLAVQALPDTERAVTEGFYLHGESQKELAERLQLPLTTVKKRLQYARKRLKGWFTEVNETLDLVFSTQQAPQQQLQPQPIYVRRRDPRLQSPEDDGL